MPLDAAAERRRGRPRAVAGRGPSRRCGAAKSSAPPVAIIAFDGMQSQRWAAPPTMSRSISVTSAPRRAAWVAAVLPAGPPPMITKRVDTSRRLLAQGSAPRQELVASGRTDAIPSKPCDGANRRRDARPTTATSRPGAGSPPNGPAAGQIDAIRGGRRSTRTRTASTARTRSARCGPGTASSSRAPRPTSGSPSPVACMLIREQGKLIFATMRDRAGELQLFVSKAVLGDDGFAGVRWRSTSATGSASRAPS